MTAARHSENAGAGDGDGGRENSLRRILRRFSVYGDFWLRFQAVGVRNCPFFIEPILLVVYSVLFFLFSPATRDPIVENLSILFPGSSRVVNFFRAFRVFWDFANCMTDAAHCRNGQHIIDWEIEGREHFDAFKDSGDGAIVLTAHMGAYDIAAPVFASEFGRKLNAVRAPERNEETQAFMKRELEGQVSDAFAVRYNASDNLLGLELIRALSQGEVVAIQGDRILFNESVLNVPINEHHMMRIPKGPFVLAMTSGKPIIPVFIIHLARRRYRIVIHPAFRCRRDGRRSDGGIEKAGLHWTGILLPTIHRNWHQWYVFETAFTRVAPNPDS